MTPRGPTATCSSGGVIVRYGWLVLVLGATACAGGGGSDDTDTDTDASSTDETSEDDDSTDETSEDDESTDDTDVEDTDVDDTDPPADAPPTPQQTSAPDYTFYNDGSNVNLYWRAATDDITAAADLEYRTTCLPSGGSATSTEWTKPASLTTEGSGRYWRATCPNVEGTYDLWVEVRDGAGNTSSYPTLVTEVLGEVIVGPK